MNRTLAALLSLSLLPFAACRTWIGSYHVGADDYVLATRDGPAGSKEVYRLDGRNDGQLRVLREHDRERPFLGLQVMEIDKARAEQRGVKPYAGLLVHDVYPGSAAAEAGIGAGDVLLSIDGKDTVYLQHVPAAEAGLKDGQVALASVLRGQERLDVPLRTRLLKERVTDQEEVPLDAPQSSHRPFAGVTLRGIPAAWCERIFGAPRQAVVITNVEVGSPAWLAGLRAGDVVDTVDGAPVPDVQALSNLIHERGEREEAVTFGVRRGQGPAHTGTVELGDYSGETNAWVPLVFRYENGTYEDFWSVGPFGLVMSNRNRYEADSSTRRPRTRNVFNAALGLFRVETTARQTEVRLLWIISFDL